MALYKDPTEKKVAKPKCIMCEGDLEAFNFGNICNACRDRMRKSK